MRDNKAEAVDGRGEVVVEDLRVEVTTTHESKAGDGAEGHGSAAAVRESKGAEEVESKGTEDFSVSHAALREVFVSENALVQTASCCDLVSRAAALAKEGSTTGRWVSSSLAPADGYMSYYGRRGGRGPVAAMVYDLRKSKAGSGDEYWCYPSGYAAKLEHNTDLQGRPINFIRGAQYGYGGETRHGVGMRSRPSHLRDDNREHRRNGKCPLYNEVYIKLGGPSGIVVVGSGGLAGVQTFIASLELRHAASLRLPVVERTPGGLQDYQRADFERDFAKLTVDDFNLLLKRLGVQKQRGVASTAKIDQAGVFLQFLHCVWCVKRRRKIDFDHLDRRALDEADYQKILGLAIECNQVELVQCLLEKFPSLIEGYQPQASYNEANIRFWALRLSAGGVKRGELQTGDAAYQTFVMTCGARLMGRHRKWQRFMRARQGATGTDLMRALCEQSLVLRKSRHRKATIAAALGLPEAIAAEDLQKISRAYLALPVT